MRTLFHQREQKARRPGSLFAILHWLVKLIRLTEDEKIAAGIYLDGSYDDIYKR